MKKFRKTLVLGMATAVLGGLVFAGCGSKDKAEGGKETSKDDKVELSVSTWNYDTTPEFEALFKAFEDANPNVTVKAIDIEAAQYDDKLTTMLAGGDKTDILTMKNLLSYSTYATRNQLVDLTDHISKEIDVEKSQGMYDYFKIDDKTYAQPYRTDFWVLYYNKKAFDDAGIAYPENLTWEEYDALATKLTTGKDSDKVYGAYHHTWRSVLQAVAGAQNDTLLTEPKYDFFEEYYNRTLKLQKDGVIMDYGTAKSTQTTYASQFETEKAMMMPMGTWYMAGVLASKEKGDTSVEWGIAPMPQKEKSDTTTTFGSPTAFAISKNSKNQEWAQKFLDFATGEEGAKILAGVGVVPSYKTEAIDEIYFSKEGMPNDAISKKAFAPETIGIEFPVHEKGGAIDKILQEEHELILVGDETPEKGIANMEKRVKQELSE